MSVIACDVSEFQPVVTDDYEHRWLTFRACDGSYVDMHLNRNLAWAEQAVKSGKLDGFTVYVVYEPGQNDKILSILNSRNVPTDCTVMIDVESWEGKIKGNRSSEINDLARSLAKRQGSQDLVWGYANRSDFDSLWPSRPDWLGLVVASYGGTKPDSPGPGPLVGWQYTDGRYTVPGLPNSSKPFGHCDHNELYLEDDMALTQQNLNDIAHAVWAFDNNGNNHAWGLLNVAANPTAFAKALVAALPADAKGGLTEAQVEDAVKKVFADAGS